MKFFIFKHVHHQILTFLQILKTMKMTKIMKIIQKIKIKATTQQANTCSKSTIEKSSCVFIVGFEHISHLDLVFVMSTLNM